jgi:hypothetical protein
MITLKKENKEQPLPIDTDYHWLTRILPNVTKIELQSISTQYKTVRDGLHAVSTPMYVFNFLCWFHDKREPELKRFMGR